MFGTWFYNKRVRTAVSVFGSLFNNIYVLRQNSSGETISQVKVPLSYAPKRNFLERLSAQTNGEENERTVAIKLPRMSFEIIDMQYDAIRQLPKTNSFSRIDNTDSTKKKKFYTAVPYDISFQLNIYAKTQDDALQIVEQVIPYFNPQYSVSVKPFSDHPDVLEDVPIILNSTSFTDDYEGGIGDRRTIIYTMTFTMKVAFYGPVSTGSVIREVNNNLWLMGEQLGDSDKFVHTIGITPTPVGVSADSDYGFNVNYLDSSQ